MKKTLLGLACCMGLPLSLCAQQQPAITEGKAKWTYQVGVQMNELIRQVFNFSNTTSPNLRNPYLLTFSMNAVPSGWGLRTGLGYNYQKFTDEDGINRKESTINDLNVRLGFDKSYTLSSRWSTGIGADVVLDYSSNKTNSVVRSFDTVTTVTNSTVQRIGGGPMGWLRYHLTERILIGTETSFYYKSGNEKLDVRLTRRDFNQPGVVYKTTTTTSDTQDGAGTLNIPVAFFLIVRF